MKPVSHQSVPSSVSGGHPNLAFDRVLSTSNVMYCEKCGFASTDAAVFKKHMMEHVGMRFYCFYCNNVSFSEAELNTHLKQHTAKYPFKCPHCGQGYMRRLCLVKHIERLHSKCNSQGPAKPGTTKNPHVPVSSALLSVPTAEPLSPRPAVRVTVPTPGAPASRLDKDEQRGKTLVTNVSHPANGNAEFLSPLNGLIQHNRALTVSLPEEVTIPAGCLVELVEVKTVNGTKELKLRLVTQENESVIKDTRTAVSQNSAQGKPLSSALNHPNTVKSMSLGACTVNRKQYETKTLNAECPAVVPVSVSKNIPNQTRNEKSRLKRTSQEIINLECHADIPNKVPKSIPNPVREGNIGVKVTQRDPVSRTAPPPAVTSTRVASRLTSALHSENMGACVSQRAAEERIKLISEHPKSLPPRGPCDMKGAPRDASVTVKLEPREGSPKSNAAVGPDQKSVNVPFAAQGRPAATVHCKNDAANTSYSNPRSLNDPSPVKKSKRSPWPQQVRANERAGEGDGAEPEGFPVISSVFSLSQQSEDSQGPIQPLVMALRGIVMDKTNDSAGAGRDHTKLANGTEPVKEACGTQVDSKDGSLVCDLSLKERASEHVKVEVEHDKGVQHPSLLADNHIHIKDEKSSTSPKDEESSPATHSVASGTADLLLQTTKSEHDITSKFLTVSLKRVQVGTWKKSKRGLKLRISKCKDQVPMGSLTDCAVIHPMPLKVDQLVKRPGPNQPVVVLNHPKPRATAQGARADTFANTGASEMAPKCQILKMRLSKVMGQKYEVMGCTVRVFP